MTDKPRLQTQTTELFARQSLVIAVVRACPHCGAPGYWHDVPGVNPGCYDPEKKRAAEAKMQPLAPVGPICPQCGGEREEIEPHGEVWAKEVRAPSMMERVKRNLIDDVRQFFVGGKQ